MTTVTYPLYRLTLPSGGTVRVRKATQTALLAAGLLYTPLLEVAVKTARGEDDYTLPNPTDYMRSLDAMCTAALAEPDILPELDITDKLFLQQWALAPTIAPAVADGAGTWAAMDFAPLVRGTVAPVLLDAIARRYGMRPSALLGVTQDLALSVEIDLAVGYRGVLGEHAGDAGEVEVEDVWGNVHRVPAHMLPATEPGARIVDADALAQRAARLGLKEMSLSAGGAIGASPSMAMGDFNRFRN